MSLTLEQSPTNLMPARPTVHQLFASMNEGVRRAAHRREEFLSTYAEAFLPQETLRKIEGSLPPHRLSVARWVGNKPDNLSLIVRLVYRSHSCHVRRSCVIVASTGGCFKGIRVCHSKVESYPLPRYADTLTKRLCRIIEGFASDFAHQ